MKHLSAQTFDGGERENASRRYAVFRFLTTRCAVLTGLLLWLLALSPPVRAQVPPAGTMVNNTARVSFQSSGLVDTMTSNTVSTRVAPVYSLRLAPPGTVASPAYTAFGAPGDTLYLPFSVTNLANAPDSASMSFTLNAASTLPVSTLIFFRDANANGRFDPGEDDPAFLALASGGSTPLDVAVVLPSTGTGTAFVEVHATSTADFSLSPATDISVLRVSSRTSGPQPPSIYFGPVGNARAVPGGDGSSDDETRVPIAALDQTVTLVGDVENTGDTDSLMTWVANSFALPPGSVVTCTDVNGTAFPEASPGRFVIGTIASGATRPVYFVVSTPGVPLRQSLSSMPVVRCTVQSRTDTTVVNSTRFRLDMPVLPDPRAMIGLDQTFRQATASVGDVASMIITVQNRTDSIRVDNVRVSEFPPSSLDFSSGDGVTYNGHAIMWNAGTLAPGESRSTTVRFVVNSRESSGWARVSGSAVGLAETGDDVTAGPVVAALRIDNEEIGIEGVILGDVFIDEDGDNHRDEGERGIPNTSVYLESGEYAVTDSLGLFSIPHVFEGYRMVRLDESTLPPGLEFATPLASRGSTPRANERMVHLLAPGTARVSFPLRHAPPPMVDRVARVTCEEHMTFVARPHRQQSLVLPSSHFALGRAALLEGGKSGLQPAADFLLQNPGWTVLIEGHTDSQPIRTERYPSNWELSQARAEAVRDALFGMGVAAERCLAIGYGDSRPIASNANVEGRRLNRRVEVSFIPPALERADRAQRIAGAVRDLSAQPDSVRTTVLWALSSSAEGVCSGTLRVDVPDALHEVTIGASMNGEALAQKDSAFVFDEFARGTPIECAVTFTVAIPDTSAIRGIVATLTLRDSTGTTEERVAAVRPYLDGIVSGAGRRVDVASWSERVLAPAVTDPLPRTDIANPPPSVKKLLEIVEPHEGFVAADRDQARVRARHPLGSRAVLRMNGEIIEDAQIGQRSVDVVHEEETTTWYGVRLRAGWNLITLHTTTGDSTMVDSVHVALASRPAEIVPLDARRLIPADGMASGTLRFAVRDGFGLPVMDGFVVTVGEGAELVAAPDARPGQRGLQLLTSEGLVTVPLLARHQSQQAIIAVEGDGMRASTEVVYVTPDRPLLATGIVDISAGVYDTDGKGNGHGIDNYTDGFDINAESRLFVQGAAPGGVNVTARLDTRKRYDDPLFKQPDPEKQYPIFGDASKLYYSAPARGGNYVSVDRGQSYLRYGDMRTPTDRGEFLTYRQAVTGLSSSLTDGANSVRAFLTRTDFLTKTDEIPADGTSGFYYLSYAPIVENSERVMVETRDRYQTEKVLESRVMIRRRDYTINPYDGSILFMEPVPVTDRAFNPNTVVVTYDVETNDERTYLFGLRGDVVEGSRYRAGLTAVSNSGPAPGYALYGVDGEVRWRGVRVGAEVAGSSADIEGDGGAYKLGAAVTRGDSKLDMYVRKVDDNFVNPSFRDGDNQIASVKAGFDGRWAFSPSLALLADGYTHELDRTDETRETVRTTMDYRRRLLEMSAGLRVARHDEPTRDARGTLALAGLTLGNRGTAGVSTTWEQNLGSEVVDDYPNRLNTQLTVPLSRRFRAIATHEYLTAPGRSTTNQITAGVEGTTDHGTQAYSRYAMDRTANDDRMGSVSGIRQRLQLSPTMSGTVGLEGFLSLSGREADEYVSLTTGLSTRVPGSHFIDAGYEYRWEHLAHRNLARMATAQQLDGGFAWLMKNILGLVADDTSHDGTQFYSTLALAWRSPSAPVQSLAMLKSHYDRYAPVDPDAIRWRLVASADVNVLATAAHELRLKYAYKYVEDWSYGASTTTQTDLILGQYLWHFGRGWDVDVWGRTVVLRNGGTEQYGAGIEMGRIVFKSVRVAAGYSVNGFDDRDIANDAWSRGFGIRIQMLLSDWLLADFEPLSK